MKMRRDGSSAGGCAIANRTSEPGRTGAHAFGLSRTPDRADRRAHPTLLTQPGLHRMTSIWLACARSSARAEKGLASSWVLVFLLGYPHPVVQAPTSCVLDALIPKFGRTLDAVKAEIKDPNIENILSRVRSLAGVIGKTPVHDLDGAGHKTLSEAICTEIGKVVNQSLPVAPSPYSDFVNWISGAERDNAVEILTTNYDLLFEQALERAKVPFFDGFAGASQPFFDPSSVASDDLPPRWVRLWKLHVSLGWESNPQGEIIRTGSANAAHLVFPEHLKYDQTQKAPYAALS